MQGNNVSREKWMKSWPKWTGKATKSRITLPKPSSDWTTILGIRDVFCPQGYQNFANEGKIWPSALCSWLIRWAGQAREMNCIMCGPSYVGLRHAGCMLKCASLLMSEDLIGQSCKRDLSSMLKFPYRKRNWHRRHYSTVSMRAFLRIAWNDPFVWGLRGVSGTLWAANWAEWPSSVMGVPTQSHLTMKLAVKFILQHSEGNCDRHLHEASFQCRSRIKPNQNLIFLTIKVIFFHPFTAGTGQSNKLMKSDFPKCWKLPLEVTKILLPSR